METFISSRDLPAYVRLINGRLQYAGLSSSPLNPRSAPTPPRCHLCGEELLCLSHLHLFGRRYRLTYCVNKLCDTNDGIVGWYVGGIGDQVPVFRGDLLDWYNRPQPLSEVPVVSAQAFAAALLPWKVC